MPNQGDVSKHYTHGGLVEAIRVGIASLGKTAETVTVDDLAPVDEFHIGGRRASEEFLAQLGLSAQMHVLDVGCGLGGAARFVASRCGSRITGIDLTSEYVETGIALSK
jgi:cyclopropane fatty-acyl-phospholipid synthase-like methyltransferase